MYLLSLSTTSKEFKEKSSVWLADWMDNFLLWAFQWDQNLFETLFLKNCWRASCDVKGFYSLKRIIKALSFRSIDHPRVSWWKPSVAADSESEQAQIEVFRISIFYSDEDVSCLGLNGAGQPHLSALLQNMHKKPISELPKTDKTRIELKSKSAKEFISSFGTVLMVRKITFNLDRKNVHDSFKMKHLVICQN